MTYTGLGEKNDQFAVWDRNVVLPMAGKIVTKVEGEIDNSPDLRAAIDLADHKEGRHVTLTEKQGRPPIFLMGGSAPILPRSPKIS